MTPNARDQGRSKRPDPTLADVLVRRLAQLGLAWATRPILGFLVLVVAVGLFAAWGLLLIIIAWIGGLLGLIPTGGSDGSAASGSTAFLVVALVASGVILFIPTRWAARNLRRVERTLDETVDRLAIPTSVGASSTVERRPTTAAELAALDARLAPAASDAGQGVAEKPDR
jgi:hypothetical protein